MRAVVVFESMFGNTRLVAERVARGLSAAGEVDVLPVGEATSEALDGVDLLVVGGPTHVHGMTTPRTRDAAHEQSHRPDASVTLDPEADAYVQRIFGVNGYTILDSRACRKSCRRCLPA